QPEISSKRPRRLGLVGDVLQVRQHRAAKLADQNAFSLAEEKCASELGLEVVDRLGESRLGDAAVRRRAREVQGSRHRERIANLGHLHVASRLFADSRKYITQILITGSYRSITK